VVIMPAQVILELGMGTAFTPGMNLATSAHGALTAVGGPAGTCLSRLSHRTIDQRQTSRFSSTRDHH
jgi:hypothetical protein